MSVTREQLGEQVQQHVTKQVRAYFERSGMTVREAAEQWGMTPSVLSSRINGRSRWTLEDVVYIGYMTGTRLIYKSNR